MSIKRCWWQQLCSPGHPKSVSSSDALTLYVLYYIVVIRTNTRPCFVRTIWRLYTSTVRTTKMQWSCVTSSNSTEINGIYQESCLPIEISSKSFTTSSKQKPKLRSEKEWLDMRWHFLSAKLFCWPYKRRCLITVHSGHFGPSFVEKDDLKKVKIDHCVLEKNEP